MAEGEPLDAKMEAEIEEMGALGRRVASRVAAGWDRPTATGNYVPVEYKDLAFREVLRACLHDAFTHRKTARMMIGSPKIEELAASMKASDLPASPVPGSITASAQWRYCNVCGYPSAQWRYCNVCGYPHGPV